MADTTKNGYEKDLEEYASILIDMSSGGMEINQYMKYQDMYFNKLSKQYKKDYEEVRTDMCMVFIDKMKKAS